MKYFYTIIIILFSSSGFGQDSTYTRLSPYWETHLAMVAGYQFQHNHFAELGLGIKKNLVGTIHPSTFIYGVSNEFKLHQDFIWGLKVFAWIGGGNGGLNLGGNIIHYTDFDQTAWVFRPEIGIGVDFFRLVYGYNFNFTNSNMVGINDHNFGINFLINTKKIKQTPY
ncbi:hypothetical protein KFE94_11275 [bacterium SCSIO 12643]|nr:hypothetical protein KFE94_11275 [bacterium SCSIO 12643]